MRTPRGATKVYDKNGKVKGFIFRNVFAQIEYDLKKAKREVSKKKRKK